MKAVARFDEESRKVGIVEKYKFKQQLFYFDDEKSKNVIKVFF